MDNIVRYQLSQQYGEIFFSTRASNNCLSSLLPHSFHYLLQFMGSERVRHDLVAEQQQQVFTVHVSLPYLPFSLKEFWFPSRKYFLFQIAHKGNLISFPASQCSKGNLISILSQWLVPQEHITKFRPRKHKKRFGAGGATSQASRSSYCFLSLDIDECYMPKKKTTHRGQQSQQHLRKWGKIP